MTKIKKANAKMVRLISFGMTSELMKWATLFEHFPITKRGKVNLILKTTNRSIILGIATNHLLSIASGLGVPDEYLKDLLRCKNDVKTRVKRGGLAASDHNFGIELRHKTYLLLTATCSLIVGNKVV